MTFILNNYKNFSAGITTCLENDRLSKEDLLGASLYRTHDKYEIMMNTVATQFLANATTAELDRFIRLFKIIDPIMCEKVFTLKISQGELLEMLKVVLKEFSLAELFRLIPAIGIKNLLLEAGYFTGDLLTDSINGFFGSDPASGTDDGFDFDGKA